MKLPVKYPLVTSYTHHSTVLSILGSNDTHLPWIYTAYIQLFSFPDAQKKCMAVEFLASTYALLNSPWLQIKSMNREQTLSLHSDVVQTWIRSLDEENYLYFGVDGFYIPAYADYQKSTFPHPLFVYGYDLEKEVFYIGDFFNHKKFDFAEASFSELKLAYTSLNPDELYGQLNFLIRYDNTRDYPLNITHVRDILTDYLQSSLTAHYPPLKEDHNGIVHWVKDIPKNAFQIGISVYRMLLSNLFQHLLDNTPIDTRIYPIVLDHKKLMLSFIGYLGEHGVLADSIEIAAQYEKVVKSADIIKMNMLKYEITAKNKELYIPQVIQYLTEMAFNEKIIFERIITGLRSGKDA